MVTKLSTHDWVIQLAQKRQMKIAHKAFTRLTSPQYSPVWTGSYIASMRINKGSIDYSTTEYDNVNDIFMSGMATAPDIKFKTGEVTPVYISNSTAHAVPIEVFGTSTMAAGGFFKSAAQAATKS